MIKKSPVKQVKKTAPKAKAEKTKEKKAAPEKPVQELGKKSPANKTLEKVSKKKVSTTIPEIAEQAKVLQKPAIEAESIKPQAKPKKQTEAKIKKKPEPVQEASAVTAPPKKIEISKEKKQPAKPQAKHVKAPEITKIEPAIAVPQKLQEAVPLKPEPIKVVEPIVYKGIIKINETTNVRDLAERMNQNAGEILKKLLNMGSLATINQRLDVDTITLIAHEFKYDVKFETLYSDEKLLQDDEEKDITKLKPRPPVVTIMGHVDHGKTSLLDAIRESNIAGKEAGGITQHIGAYKVKLGKGQITFLDTPGHEAFTAMRSRGAQVTDLVVLVVSADDGIMPQTIEAIDHAKAAGVPIIVAVNKIDLPTANPAQVRQELNKYNLIPEEWGGDTIVVDISAKKLINIDTLFDMILLKAEMMELKANPDRRARGVVIEAKLDARRGPVAAVLVQKGTLKVGDNFIVGTIYGKVRAMIDEHGHRLIEAAPSTPVEIMGIASPPQAGDTFIVVENEQKVREIAQTRQIRARQEALRPRHHLALEDISTGKIKELRLIVKTDVQGSLGALLDSIQRMPTAEIKLNIIHSGAGGINESDVMLAAASDALIIGFNVKPDPSAEKIADHEGVNIRIYRIIYEVLADVKAALEGLLEPTIKEVIIGKAHIKQVFKVSKVGTVLGSIVDEGKIQRGAKARLLRDNVIKYEGNISSLKRFKDDVREVEKGFECGLSLENFSDAKQGDIIEVYTQEKIARKL